MGRRFRGVSDDFVGRGTAVALVLVFPKDEVCSVANPSTLELTDGEVTGTAGVVDFVS